MPRKTTPRCAKALVVILLVCASGSAATFASQESVSVPPATQANGGAPQRVAAVSEETRCLGQVAELNPDQVFWSSGDLDALLMGSSAAGVPALGVSTGAEYTIPPGEFLGKARQAGINDALYLQELAGYCAEESREGDSLCDLQPELRLTQLRPGNGFYWMILGQRQYRDGDKTAALRSFRVASEQNLFSVRWGARIGRYYRTMLTLFPEQKTCALSYAANSVGSSLYRHLSAVSETCRSNIDDAEWVGVCLNLGGAMEQRGRTLSSVLIGLAIQRSVYEGVGAEKGIVQAKARTEEIKTAMRQAPTSTCFPFASPEAERAWRARLEAVGEMAFLRESIELGKCPI